MSNKVLSVSQYVEYINQTLSTFSSVLVEGEVSDFSINRNKWVSFDLKDEENEQILPCFTGYGLFKSMGLDESLEDGMKVKVRGDVKVRDKGHFSMFMKKIQLSGEGTLKKAYKKLKKKLKQKGYFVDSRKRSLPRFPQKIGVITSSEAQAYSDFLKVLQNRIGGLEIFHSEVHVQGENAVPEIVQAFQTFNKTQQDFDLIVLTRGGGSLEDLQAFNSEEVAKAVFTSDTPVVCGVGHEDDVTLAGLTADMRASTPSNAAELIVEERSKLISEIDYKINRIEVSLNRMLEEYNKKIVDFIHAGENFITQKKQKLERIALKLNHELERFGEQCNKQLTKVYDLINNCYDNLTLFIEQKNNQIKHKRELLDSYSPKATLNRGYSIVTKGNKVLTNTDNITKGDLVNVTLSKGDFNSKVVTTNS